MSTRYEVFFYEAFEEEQKALKAHLPAGLNAGFSWKTIQEAGRTEPPAPIISIRTQTEIPKEWLKKFKALLTRSTGYDHVLRIPEKYRSRLSTGYLPLYCKRAVAEQACMMWLCLLRRLPLQTEQFKSFKRDGLTGGDCEGRILLVIGAGNIGAEAARIGKGLGMHVFAVDPVKKHDDLTYTTLEKALPKAHVILCAMDLNETNHNFFNEALLRKMRKGAIFINIARGEMVSYQACLALLEAGHLGGVGTDVYPYESELAVALRQKERPPATAETEAVLRMAERTDTILTPHNAFNTRESVKQKAEQSAQQVTHFLRYGEFLWKVPAGGTG